MQTPPSLAAARRRWEVLYFVNPPGFRSVLNVQHAHVISRPRRQRAQDNRGHSGGAE